MIILPYLMKKIFKLMTNMKPLHISENFLKMIIDIHKERINNKKKKNK